MCLEHSTEAPGWESLDRWPNGRHNQVVPRQTVLRAGALALLLALGPATYLRAVCTGWRASAAERMACCERSGHACGSIDADDCCADGEQRQNIEGTPFVLLPSDATVTRAVPPASPRRTDRRDARAVVTHPETYLLDSVLLI
jgi:hypothetical protein